MRIACGIAKRHQVDTQNAGAEWVFIGYFMALRHGVPEVDVHSRWRLAVVPGFILVVAVRLSVVRVLGITAFTGSFRVCRWLLNLLILFASTDSTDSTDSIDSYYIYNELPLYQLYLYRSLNTI